MSIYCRCNPDSWDHIFDYLKYISTNPNLDDLKTIGNIVKRTGGDRLTIMSDLLPGPNGIQAIVEKLPPDEQEKAKDFFASLSNDPWYVRMMQSYGWGRSMSGEFRFDNPRIFEEALRTMMSEDYPSMSVAAKLIANNKHLIDLVDIDLVNEFVDWANQKQKEESNESLRGGAGIAAAILKSLHQDIIPEEAPVEVRQVGELLLESAARAGEPLDSVYISQQRYKNGYEWALGDNFERGFSFLIFRDSNWYWRNPGGDDTLIKDNINGAKKLAITYYRGKI